MRESIEITYRNMVPSEVITALVEEKARKLSHFYERIQSCRVVIEVPHRHKHKGRHYVVHLEVILPGEDVFVDRDPQDERAFEDIHVAINDAFDAAKRRLQDLVRIRRDH